MADPSADAHRQRELELRANRMELASRWADDLAHEIKNPLHAMVINLELVKRRAGAPDPEPLIERAQVVEDELDRVHGLVESLLRMVRPWPEEDRANVDTVFSELLPALSARARIRKLDLRHSPGGGTVAMGSGPLGLVVLNLIDYVMEGMPEGGQLATACQVADEHVRITILGRGVERPAAGDQATAPPAPGDSGLGLAIAHRLVNDAGGTIDLEPAPGDVGTLATVALPRVGAA